MADITRQINIEVQVDRWTWRGEARKENTYTLTPGVLSYRFQKSIKNPGGSCQVSLIPQIEQNDKTIVNVLNITRPMDVVRIREFGQLKFIGYVTRVAYSGAINPSTGKPTRVAIITCQQFGNLLATSSIGFGLGTALGTEQTLFVAARDLQTAFINAGSASYVEFLSILIQVLRTYLQGIGITGFIRYLNEYIDTESGLISTEEPGIPRIVKLFDGTETSVTFWSLAEKLSQKPFNELWIDNGPRRVYIDGRRHELQNERSILIFRPTPFNGTVVQGTIQNQFDAIEEIHIPRDYFLQFDLSTSMEEVYTFYSVKNATFGLSTIARTILGEPIVDEQLIDKYLLKPFVTELFYSRTEKVRSDEISAPTDRFIRASEDAAQTLKNWYEHNEDYYSGVITIMVPDENQAGFADPRIGDKISVEGIRGAFYVEGIAHIWQYNGALKTNLTVTRGFNYQSGGRPVVIDDALFTRNTGQNVTIADFVDIGSVG